MCWLLRVVELVEAALRRIPLVVVAAVVWFMFPAHRYRVRTLYLLVVEPIVTIRLEVEIAP